MKIIHSDSYQSIRYVRLRTICFPLSQIAVQNIKISEEVQALLAPAILPRSFLSLQVYF